MNLNKTKAILIGLIAIAGLAGVFFVAKTIGRASEYIDLNPMTFIPLIVNQSAPGAEPSGERIAVTPTWEMGASSEDPTKGSGGTLTGWYTKTTYTNGVKIDLELYLHVKGGTPGIGTGTYEIYLPDELEPSLDQFVGHANMWIAGGGISEFDGSVKWTFRNTVKGPKLIFTFDGREWSPTEPKTFADLKLRANISYWL
jgi:hypothetical protein